MEKKTIGSFIAALRRANGLTQRELAEKLNVSDKTVSRWERDEGTPDLALIPVLAELFGVTSDELLLGQRRSTAQAAPQSGEKQRRRLLSASLAKYRSTTCLAAGLAICGLIAALVGNFAFLRAYLGFFAGAVLCLASAIVQFAAVNTAFLAIDGEEISPEQSAPYRRRVIRAAEGISGLIVTILGATSALLLVGDAYLGLSAASFLPYGLLFGGAAFLLWAAALWAIHHRLVKRGTYPLNEKESAAYHHNFNLKKYCILSLGAVLIFTALLHGLTTGFGDASRVAEGTVFTDIADFKAYMEQDVPPDEGHLIGDAAPESEAGILEDAQFYDQWGTPIPEAEALTRTITSPSGAELCRFVERNHAVVNWQCSFIGEDFQSATAYTYDQMDAARVKIHTANVLFAAVYLVECLICAAVYAWRRQRL